MSRRYVGTGLGLCSQLVTLMRGGIGVQSRPGLGSCFWFTLALPEAAPRDAVSAQAAAEAALAQLQQRHAGTPVLLVDDEPVSGEATNWLMQQAGLVVLEAKDGVQALAIARSQALGLTLMDMQLPHMTGLEATLAIRDHSLNQRTPILAMTANAFDDDRQRCLPAAMDGHLVKPMDSPSLHQTALA